MATISSRLQFTQPIRGLIARHVLGLASASDIVDCAHAMLDAGYYSGSLGEIITIYGENSFELNRRFAQVFDETEPFAISQEDPVEELAAQYFIPIAERRASPLFISELAYYDHNAIEHSRYPGHPLCGKVDWGPVHTLIGYYYRYDYPEEFREETNAMIDNECFAFAKQWTRMYWRPVLNPAWLTPTVQSIAACIYQDRAFDRLPILADALEEAGCTNADVLLHCRQPGEHVRGCWVVDLVLGKK